MKKSTVLIAVPGLLASMTALAAGSHHGGHDVAAIGEPGVSSRVTRTIHIDMKDDMRFHSSKVQR